MEVNVCEINIRECLVNSNIYLLEYCIGSGSEYNCAASRSRLGGFNQMNRDTVRFFFHFRYRRLFIVITRMRFALNKEICFVKISSKIL